VGDFETRMTGCYNNGAMDKRLKPLSEETVRRNLNTQFVGRKFVYYERIGSTNDIAKQLAQSGEPEGTIVVADDQVAGRGRFGRTWVAPAYSSLLVSLILRPPLQPAQIARVTMAVALGACDGIHSSARLDARIKWPNDILVKGKKCAGVLSEANITGGQIEYAVCGLGVNVNFSAAGSGIPEEATTLADETGSYVERERLLGAILSAIEQYYVRIKNGGTLHAEWAARMATLHQAIRAQTPWGEETGLAEAVDEDGALVLRRADGSAIRLVSADVTLLPRKAPDQ
jgi:BirA family biotin operon repressor/biotin-[acetyl-CoA-carboxylase] ligase